jgi:pyrroloquinoline-quinone synthase
METMADIEREIAARHLLTHPFYKAWTDGTLPRASLLEYARQYFAFEVRLPRFLTALHARSEDRAVRTALLSNAWDEEHGELNHAELWLRFTDALGLTRDEVITATPSPATAALVGAYREACERAPVTAGVAALYAYESQLPAVAESKIDGLVRHFGFGCERSGETSRSGLAFFQVHQAIDVAHAGAERRLLDSAIAAGEGEAALDGARKALAAWWDFLTAFVPAEAAAV